MSWINIYLCIIGTLIFRFLIKDTGTYLFACVLLGLGLGILEGVRR